MSYIDKVMHHIEPLSDLLWVSSDEEKHVSKSEKERATEGFGWVIPSHLRIHVDKSM